MSSLEPHDTIYAKVVSSNEQAAESSRKRAEDWSVRNDARAEQNARTVENTLEAAQFIAAHDPLV
jgi:hypothetical protein